MALACPAFVEEPLGAVGLDSSEAVGLDDFDSWGVVDLADPYSRGIADSLDSWEAVGPGGPGPFEVDQVDQEDQVARRPGLACLAHQEVLWMDPEDLPGLQS